MKRWALVVVLMYLVIMAAVLGLVIIGAFFPDSIRGLLEAARKQSNFGWPPDGVVVFHCFFWGWIAVMALAQTALLVVPVRVAAGRPTSRRWIVWPCLAALLLLAMLVGGMYLAAYETLDNTDWAGPWTWTAAYCGVAAVWLVWAFLFGFYTGARPPQTFVSRTVKFLLAGSVLELLVAIPAHVLARLRNYCCAGFCTFWGLAAGFSVMLVAFGPATFVLFARRYASLRPRRGRDRQEAPRPDEGQVPAPTAE